MDLDKKTMAEIRSYAHPPKLVHDVMRASLLLLGDHEGKTRVIAITLLQSSRREPLINNRGLLKDPHQFDVFARLISNSFCENSKLRSIHYEMLARLCNFCI